MNNNIFCEIMNNALKGHYSVGAFNFINMEGLFAICETAQKNHSPAICAISESALNYMGEEIVSYFKEFVKKQFTVPLCFHLDHGTSVNICKKAVDLGFDSVMIDLSNLSFEENIAGTCEVVEYAHKHNVAVEAELGSLKGTEEDIENSENIYTNPEDAKMFVEKTKVDALAVSIGTSHGVYKINNNENTLRIDILKEIQNKLPCFPLVLHGASSVDQNLIKKINNFGEEVVSANGIPEKFLEEVSKMNICKINIDSDLRIAFFAKIREFLTLNKENLSTKEILKLTKDAQCEVIEHKMKNVFHSAFQAN